VGDEEFYAFGAERCCDGVLTFGWLVFFGHFFLGARGDFIAGAYLRQGNISGGFLFWRMRGSRLIILIEAWRQLQNKMAA